MSKAEKRACQYTGYCRNKSYSDFINGYQQAEKDLLEKVVKWLIENTHDYDGYEKPFVIFNIVETQKEMINELKIAMKDE